MTFRRRAASDDRGVTLPELLVVIVLFAIVGGIVVTLSVSGLHHQTEVQDRSDTLAQARTALERIDRDIRSAYPLLSVSPTRLVLQEVQPTVTRTMTYAVSGSQLVVSETDTPIAGGAATSSNTVLLRNLVSTVTNPVFSVAPVTGYVAPAGSGVNAVTCAMTGSSSYDPGCVGKVTVHVMVQPATLKAAVSLSDNGTELRNAP
ncbi:MAG TPA: type II secretion system protein [Mycobacteriales bacterium]|nr:type II secretion system protein [Mycobacteriales bacterium]